MERIINKQIRENLKHVENLIKEYEELKNTPNVNPLVYLAHNYIVMEFKLSKDEHSEHLGI